MTLLQQSTSHGSQFCRIEYHGPKRGLRFDMTAIDADSEAIVATQQLGSNHSNDGPLTLNHVGLVTLDCTPNESGPNHLLKYAFKGETDGFGQTIWIDAVMPREFEGARSAGIYAWKVPGGGQTFSDDAPVTLVETTENHGNRRLRMVFQAVLL